MRKAYEYICKGEAFVARSALVLMVGLIFTAGIARLMDRPINWAVDMATFLFAWCCFLSADIAWRENRLMAVEVFVSKFPQRVRRCVKALHYLIISVFLVYLIVFGLGLSHASWARTFQGIPGFSYTWVTLSVPVGAFLMLISTILKIRREFFEKAGREAEMTFAANNNSC